MALQITDVNVNEILSSGNPVVIDFWATWCGPCIAIAPIIDELASEYDGKVMIGKCNVDEEPDTSGQYGIRNIPTLLFFKDGKLVDKQVGAATKSAIKAKIDALL